MFSFRSFMVSGLTFRSLTHFEFIFVYGVRKCSNFILLHVAALLSQHHLSKSLSFLHCIYSWLLCCRLIDHSVWVYFWALYSVPLIYESVSVPVPCCFDYCSFVIQSEVWARDNSRFILFSQDCFSNWASLVVPKDLFFKCYITLDVEKHRFELCRSTYMQTFFQQ